MSNYAIYALAEAEMTISGGEVLSGGSHGDGSNLLFETITLDSNAWQQVFVSDGGTDANFSDSDTDQLLDGDQTIFGESYTDGMRVEAEYTLTVEDPDGNFYTLIGFNINEVGAPNTYGTTEGLAFIGTFPPVGVALTVTGTVEGPPNTGGSSTPATNYAEPPCFASGTLIDTPNGPRLVEKLRPGDHVLTLDHGSIPVRWLSFHHQPLEKVAQDSKPVLLKQGCLGSGFPRRDLVVSANHRVLVGPKGQLPFLANRQMFVPAKALVGLPGIRFMRGRRAITWVHFACDVHNIVCAEGSLMESLLLGPMVLQTLPAMDVMALQGIFPGRTQKAGVLNGPIVRECLTVSETRRRIAAHKLNACTSLAA